MRRSFCLATPESSPTSDIPGEIKGIANPKSKGHSIVESGTTMSEEYKTILQVQYLATTNRMLRVAVNGFMESLGVVLGVMEELDLDVLAENL